MNVVDTLVLVAALVYGASALTNFPYNCPRNIPVARDVPAVCRPQLPRLSSYHPITGRSSSPTHHPQPRDYFLVTGRGASVGNSQTSMYRFRSLKLRIPRISTFM